MPLIRYLNRSPPSLAIWTWFLSLWIWSTAITYDQKIQWNTTGFTQPVASPKFTIYIHQRLINFSQPASHIKSSNSKVYLFRHSYTYWKKDNLIFDGFHVPWKSIKFLHFKTRKKHTLIHTQYHNRMSGNFIYKSKIRLLVAGSSLIGGILNNFRISTSDILINQILDFLHIYSTSQNRTFDIRIHKPKSLGYVTGSIGIGGIFQKLKILTFKFWLFHNVDFLTQIRMELSIHRRIQSAKTSNIRYLSGICNSCFITAFWTTFRKCTNISIIGRISPTYSNLLHIICHIVPVIDRYKLTIYVSSRNLDLYEDKAKKLSMVQVLTRDAQSIDCLAFFDHTKTVYYIYAVYQTCESLTWTLLLLFVDFNGVNKANASYGSKNFLSKRSKGNDLPEVKRFSEDRTKTVQPHLYNQQGVIQISVQYFNLIKELWTILEHQQLRSKEEIVYRLTRLLNFKLKYE